MWTKNLNALYFLSETVFEEWAFYKGRLYKTYEAANFDDAKIICESAEGNLATAEDADRNAYIRSLMS